MHAAFWQARWARNEIGFHAPEVNPYLRRHWPALGLPAGSRVLVPLCGKSLDMSWLLAQGYRVLGVELAQRAVEDYFAEQGLHAQRAEQGGFNIYRAGGLELWCGDFFALTAADVADCAGFYDRAALIALPAPMREQYVAHLRAILPPRALGLLIGLDYPQDEMDGPPFAVDEEELDRLFGLGWQLQRLEQQQVLEQNSRFAQRGLTRLTESVYRLGKQ